MLTVLPQGGNVEYSHENKIFDGKDIDYYLCSVYVNGVDLFKEWAKKHEFSKIVVGGYEATITPQDFIQYAHKIVKGPCDDFFETVKQDGQIVKGIVNFKEMPRYDLHDPKNNKKSIPELMPGELLVTINTSQGCPHACDFCQTPLMFGRNILSKPLGLVRKEVEHLKTQNPDYLFIRDENFTALNDFKERLSIIGETGAKIWLFSSANTLNEEKIKCLKENGVYMVLMGLEDITQSYSKNKNIDKVSGLLHENGIYPALTYIVDPLSLDTDGKISDYFGKLSQRFKDLKPALLYGYFLLPLRGTPMYEKYRHLILDSDFKNYDFSSAFLVRDPVQKEKLERAMIQCKSDYYTSDFYRENVREFECGDQLHLTFEREKSKWMQSKESNKDDAASVL